MNYRQRYEVELQRLIKEGKELEAAIVYECSLKEIKDMGIEAILERAERMGWNDGDDEIHIPFFREEYQQWYSDAEAVVRQLLPSHLEDFCGYYQMPNSQERMKITDHDYRISDYLVGHQVMTNFVNGHRVYVLGNPIVLHLFKQQLSIVKAAAKRLDSSLHEIKQLVQADLFDSELDASKELMNSGFLPAAGMMAAVVMERHLAQVCENHGIGFKKEKEKLTINDFNKGLKDNNVIDTSEWRRNQYLGDLRNSCAHYNKGEEVTKEKVEELIGGVTRIIKTLS